MPKLGDMMGLEGVVDFSTPLPEDLYKVEVEAFDDPKPTRAGDKMMAKVTLVVTQGEFEGRKIWANLITASPEGKGVSFTVNFINAVLKTEYAPNQLGDVDLPNGWATLVGETLMVRTKHRDWEGKTQVDIASYLPYHG